MAIKNQKIYLVRHGQTQWSLSGKHTGITDIALTEEGKKDASLVGSALKNIPIAHVLSSPLIRALDSAKIAGFQNIEINANLMEWNYGQYEGIKTVDIEKIEPNWNVFDNGCPGGETAMEVGKRADIIIEIIKEQDGDVVIFSHAHFLRVLAARWLNLGASYGKLLYLNTSSISILGFEHNINEPIIRSWNSTDHLKNTIYFE